MTQRLKAILLGLMATLTVMGQGVAFEPEGTTLEQASAKAKAQHKLIFLDCFTQWCGPCKKMGREVFPLDSVGAYMNPKFVNLQIDMESEYGTPLARRLQISAYPTFIIFNANAQEIGRFLGYHEAGAFIAALEEKSRDLTTTELQLRWENGERDPEFLRAYLATLTATYKVNEANDVAEAILDGQEETFAADSTLRAIFFRNINNPFAKSFIYTVKNPTDLQTAAGENAVAMKIGSVLESYRRRLVIEGESTATLDQQNFDRFVALLSELGIADADHYRLSTLITLAEKQKDYVAYIGYIKEYLSNPTLDASDMQLANWAKPFAAPDADQQQKEEMKALLRQRVEAIHAGQREAQTQIGNMHLSRPTDELLEMIIDAFDGKMPGR